MPNKSKFEFKLFCVLNHMSFRLTKAIVLPEALLFGHTTTTDQSDTVSEGSGTLVPSFTAPPKPLRARGGKKHNFIPKTVRLPLN